MPQCKVPCQDNDAALAVSPGGHNGDAKGTRARRLAGHETANTHEETASRMTSQAQGDGYPDDKPSSRRRLVERQAKLEEMASRMTSQAQGDG